MRLADYCSRRDALKAVCVGGPAAALSCSSTGPRVVLTFDDAVKSDRYFVAPLLRELGFSATFFVTHRWMSDEQNFMSWEEIAEIAEMGFEIGNHSWSHPSFAIPKHAARMEGELALVENELARVGVEKPVSFAWCGNRFGPEALAKLRALGYTFGRRGMSPDLDDRALEAGPAFDPSKHDPLLIPSTGISRPGWTPALFDQVLERAGEGIVVLQFHGVPDIAHEWVTTQPAEFEEYMRELKSRGARTMAVRDLLALLPGQPATDPAVEIRNGAAAEGELAQPVEVVQTRADLDRWSGIMARHRYSVDEARLVGGLSDGEAFEYGRKLAVTAAGPRAEQTEVLPYPGGRHPRIGFREGAIDPLRGTKASVFLPWDPESYVVIDLPELITSDLGHLFLAHTHVPTIWTERNEWLDNVDMRQTGEAALELEWALPNGIAFGSALRTEGDAVDLSLWLRNGLDRPLRGLRTQLCVMLKAASGFNAQTLDNKVFDAPVSAVRSEQADRWILVAWDRSGRCWGNVRCPCMHSDPVFQDCAPGETVRLRGRLWFHQGASIGGEVEMARREFRPLPAARRRA
ncbi:MAG: polysaccharide deacetylase family protein [Bryobacterales bacterium]|nr:polysaccharide deacetylase family protein [Bryobacterales bacterium]